MPPKKEQIEPCDDFEEYLLEDYDEKRHSSQKPRRTVSIIIAWLGVIDVYSLMLAIMNTAATMTILMTLMLVLMAFQAEVVPELNVNNNKYPLIVYGFLKVLTVLCN